MQTQRTPDELKDPELNYYFAYGVDPDEKDVAKISHQLMLRKCSFTQGTIIQRRLMDLFTEALDIMKDSDSRAEEFLAAKNIKLDYAKHLIKMIIKGRGVVYKTDLIKIADASGRWITADEIKAATAHLLIQAKFIDDLNRSLDFLTYDRIEKLLKGLGKKNDIYEVLEITPDHGISELLEVVKNLYAKICGKTDPKSTVINQICGEARKIFRDDNSKKFYDIYLATKEIWQEICLRRSCGITELECTEYDNYLNNAKNVLSAYDAYYVESLLAEGLAYYRISILGKQICNRLLLK